MGDKKRKYFTVFFVWGVLLLGLARFVSAQADLTRSGIHITGIKDAEVTVCVTPDADILGGKFIIRPRCDNINLTLRCPPGNPSSGSEELTGRGIGQKLLVERALGIECPSRTSCNENTSDCKDDLIDVIQVPSNADSIVPLCVTCALPSRFDLSPPGLGIQNGRQDGITVPCSLEARFVTTGIRDPAPPIDDFVSSVESDWCREGNDGVIPLTDVDQWLHHKNVCFEFPVGSGPMGTPWLRECNPPVVIGPPIPIPGKGGGPGGIDDDGYEDTTEDSGVVLASNMHLVGGSHPSGSSTNIPACSSTTDSYREFCLHKGTQDLFAILHPLSNNSYFPNMDSLTELNDFFSKISAPLASGGLGITVHPLEQPMPTWPDDPRAIADGQRAIRIVEKNDSLSLPINKDTEIVLGYTVPGTPKTSGWIDIYTVKVKQYICDLCGGTPDSNGVCWPAGNFGTSNCKSDSTLATGDALVKEYTRYVNHHETGHSLLLVDPGDDGYPYHHEPGGDETRFMTPSVTYTKRGSRVTFYMPDYFCSECGNAKKLE